MQYYKSFLKATYRFNAISIKILPSFNVKIYKLIVKNIERCKEFHITKTTLKNKVEGLTLLDYKYYCKVTIIRAVCGIILQTNGSTEQDKEID